MPIYMFVYLIYLLRREGFEANEKVIVDGYNDKGYRAPLQRFYKGAGAVETHVTSDSH